MKSIGLLIFLTFSLFAGGDILPIEPMTKFEKMDNDWSSKMDYSPVESLKQGEGCLYDNIKPAKLLPYYGEDIPDAQTESYSELDKC